MHFHYKHRNGFKFFFNLRTERYLQYKDFHKVEPEPESLLFSLNYPESRYIFWNRRHTKFGWLRNIAVAIRDRPIRKLALTHRGVQRGGFWRRYSIHP